MMGYSGSVGKYLKACDVAHFIMLPGEPKNAKRFMRVDNQTEGLVCMLERHFRVILPRAVC